MNGYLTQMAAAVRATTFHSSTTYSWFGQRSIQLSRSIQQALTPKTARSYLLFNLQSRLYTNFYCSGFATPTRFEAAAFPVAGKTPFVVALSTANTGNGYWESGWRAHTLEDGRVGVRRGGLSLWVRTEDCLTPRGALLTSGIRLSVHFPKELLGISPGFYMAFSNEEFTEEDAQSLVRFYWNLTAEGAICFVRLATAGLNDCHIPFKLKVLNEPARFTRCDAVVLYIPKSAYATTAALLASIYSKTTTYLKQETPAFTKPLAIGVGFAEDPGQGDSFGLHRCRLLANGMIRAYEEGVKSGEDRLAVVVRHWIEAGLSLEQPFLNAGSNDHYDFKLEQPRVQAVSVKAAIYPADDKASDFLRTAHVIGQRLVQEAVWHQDRCNWVGSVLSEHRFGVQHSSLIYSALSPELYAGTSGVALFLAQLSVATADPAMRYTALGAIRQALNYVDLLPPSKRLGFYSGWAGIAFAAARIGIILGEEALLRGAALLVQRVVSENPGTGEFDLFTGNAGAIMALIVLRYMLADASLLDCALKLGDELLRSAEESDGGYSWKSPTYPNHHNLTGFSHGTAGVGYALAELFQVTGEAKYRRAAELAFHYERYWFSGEVGNWPDFRDEPSPIKRKKRPLAFATFWCHGAPGIALSRLRAYTILKDEMCKAEAMTALQTTQMMTEKVLHAGIGDFSLCHGLAGNAEVLRYGTQVLGQTSADTALLAYKVAKAGIEFHSTRGALWPCGTGGGETPALMLGLSGIGYFYLRLYDPTIPSILILQAEDFLKR